MTEKSKSDERQEILDAMKKFKKPVRIVTKEDELMELAKGDYTDFTMRCGESGIVPGYQHHNN